MADKASEPVRVTAEERLHPALRKLARACIALARDKSEKKAPLGSDSAALGKPRPPALPMAISDAQEQRGEADHD